MKSRAAILLERIRRRAFVPLGHRVAPRMVQKIITVSLYGEDLEYLDRLSDALRRHENACRNRSGAVRWLIEQDRLQGRSLPEPRS